MNDKSNAKKPGKSIKEKRADKKAKGATANTMDAVSQTKKR